MRSKFYAISRNDIEVSEGEVVYCFDCGAALCKECGAIGVCSSCAEVWGRRRTSKQKKTVGDGVSKRTLFIKVLVVYH